MTVEIVQAVGNMLGATQDMLGPGPAGTVAPAANAPPPGGLPAGSGLATEATTTGSSQLSAHAVRLSELDAQTHSQTADLLAAHAAGRAQASGIVDGATGDVQTLGPASNTPQGQRALVTALTQRLQDAKQLLQDHDATATTHAAASNSTATQYHTLGQFLPSGATSASPASGTSMAAMPLAGLGGLPGMMDSQAGGQSASQQKDPRTAGFTDDSAISAVVQRALSQHGTPYSWGGGGRSGPGRGDDGIVGFDCSSLMQYAFAGAGMDLPRTTYDQIGLGQSVSPGAVRAGDLIFSNFGEGGIAGPGHVQLAISSTHVVEAPHTGANVQVSAIPAGHVVVRRVL